MNIVEAYRKAVKCGGKIKCGTGIYTIAKNGDVLTYFDSVCNLTEGWLTKDNFEVIEPPKPKYSFTEAFKMMEQGKIMLNGIKLYKIQDGFLLCSGLKCHSYVTSTVTCFMVNSNTWEVYDGQS